jgi:Holliday junction resolvase
MMGHKSAGINAERQLLHDFWKAGWACVRVAGSGSSRYPSVDLLAAKRDRKFAIECKSTLSLTKYFPNEEIQDLKIFAELFGAEPWIAIRFRKQGWLFLTPKELRKTEKGYCASLHETKVLGHTFEELTAKKDY